MFKKLYFSSKIMSIKLGGLFIKHYLCTVKLNNNRIKTAENGRKSKRKKRTHRLKRRR